MDMKNETMEVPKETPEEKSLRIEQEQRLQEARAIQHKLLEEARTWEFHHLKQVNKSVLDDAAKLAKEQDLQLQAERKVQDQDNQGMTARHDEELRALRDRQRREREEQRERHTQRITTIHGGFSPKFQELQDQQKTKKDDSAARLKVFEAYLDQMTTDGLRILQNAGKCVTTHFTDERNVDLAIPRSELTAEVYLAACTSS
jgi:hypothetical protein